MNDEIKTTEHILFSELSQLIEQSKRFVVQQANSVLTMLFWNVGKRINESILQNKCAEIANMQIATTDDSILPFNVFKDPYFLDFLNLPKGYLETDLEDAILRELERFILEMGKGFAFVERQKRMIIGDEDFHLDLLFYNRSLRRLVAI